MNSDQPQTAAWVRPTIAELATYKPVVPFATLAEKLGRAPEEIIKLDANENLYGPPPAVLEALRGLTDVHLYPDPDSAALRDALAETIGVPAGQLLVGAGSDELLALITRLVLDPGDALLDCPPTFGMYAFFATVRGAEVVAVPRHADFSLDLDAIEEAVARERPKLLCIAAPNNPDGGGLAEADFERLLALPLLLVLDEAYVEFADDESRIRRTLEHDNLIVLRTFSKAAGLAGLRVGYGAFPASLMPHLLKIKEPYTVSAAAHAAALAFLADVDYPARHRARVRAERARLWAALDALDFLEPYPTQANFILCRVVGRDALEVKHALESEGILVRHFTGKPGMADFLRITVGRPEQNDRVLEVLEVLAT